MNLGLNTPSRNKTGDGKATRAKSENRLGQIAPRPVSAKVAISPATNVSRTSTEASRLGAAADMGEVLISWRLTSAFDGAPPLGASVAARRQAHSKSLMIHNPWQIDAAPYTRYPCEEILLLLAGVIKASIEQVSGVFKAHERVKAIASASVALEQG